MKNQTLMISLLILIYSANCFGQSIENELRKSWQIGLGFGELPMHGSLKPSITFGYHFSEQMYLGVIYQFKDKINRNETSFNAKSNGLQGLVSASEEVAQRFMFQFRYSPFKNGPYISTGILYNGTDRETMIYDSRFRNIPNEGTKGNIIILQERPSGWGLGLGFGYQHNFKNGLAINAEWTPAWFKGYADPVYSFSGSAPLSGYAKTYLKNKMDQEFKSTVTNLYKVFHIGMAYRFK
ncbi:hypothetical protein [Flexithrix dorotheae]|uniref:hypothetical protein n=1 Tax=Flexithrix dorotheae TaxID=70993 RepID=UPI000477CB1F|nr:hypothetical protein [Flexithrix dorotheae]